MKILTGGLAASFQDLGRWGYQAAGINVGGAMDTKSLRLLNILLGNDDREAALEIHFPSPQLCFEEHACIAITGADFYPLLNGSPLDLYKTYEVKPDDTLVFKKKIHGERCYLGVQGGFAIDEWLGSCSHHKALPNQSPLAKNSCIKLKKTWNPSNTLRRRIAYTPVLYNQTASIQFIPQSEYYSLTSESKQLLANTPFQISSQSNRMGYRLLGRSLSRINDFNILSGPVTKGIIQLLPSGQLIVLLADTQTTGGYPIIGKIAETHLPKLVQLPLGGEITFQAISNDAAQLTLYKLEQYYAKLAKSIELNQKP